MRFPYLLSTVAVQENAQRRLIMTVLVAALLVVAARTIAPFEVGKDQALQLEAAMRLVHGKGLTYTYDTKLAVYDISQAPAARALTWWPPIFSLVAAGLIKLNLPLSTALKLIYVPITMMGWIGWAIIAAAFLAAPLRVAGKRIPLGFVIAAVSPIFFTLSWGGTDIILWAGIPYLILLLFKASYTQEPNRYLAAAGAMLGLLYGVRYASSFLGIAALLFLFLTSAPNYKVWIKKSAVFFLSALLAALPVILFVKLFNDQGGSLPEYIDASHPLTRLSQTLSKVLYSLPVISNSLFSTPLFEELVLNKIGSRTLSVAFGGFCISVMIALPAIFFWLRRRAEVKQAFNLPLALSCLPISLVALLAATVLITDQALFEISRYHEPIRLYSIMLYYGLAASTVYPRAIRYTATAFLLVFLGYSCLYLPVRAVTPIKRDDVVRFVLGFTPGRSDLHTSTSQTVEFPSNKIYSLKENSREKLRSLHLAYPNAIFFMNNYPFYVYDDCSGGQPCPGVELRKLPDKTYWRNAYTSRPLKIFWVLSKPSDLPGWLAESNRRLIYTDRFEKTLIFESDFPAGHKF
jgi:hypothetical protein